jgi:hypothetical protein
VESTHTEIVGVLALAAPDVATSATPAVAMARVDASIAANGSRNLARTRLLPSLLLIGELILTAPFLSDNSLLIHD